MEETQVSENKQIRSSTPITQWPQCVDQISKELSCKKDFRLEDQDRNVKTRISIDFNELERKEKLELRSRLLGRVANRMKARPPTVKELLDAHQLINTERTLDEIVFNYGYLSYDGLYENYEWFENAGLDESLDNSSTENFLELEQLFIKVSNFTMYERAIRVLKKNSKLAKEILVDLANEAVEPACYALAVVYFKETLSKCDILNNSEDNIRAMETCKDDIKVAVELLKFATLMEPACSFVLGMLKRYNIGNINRFIDKRGWEKDLIKVMDVASNSGMFKIPQYVFDTFGYENTRKCGPGMKRKNKYLNEITKYAIYEVAVGMPSECFYVNAQNDLLKILLKEEFPPALFHYSTLLFQKKLCSYWTVDKIAKEIIDYLNRAIFAGHYYAKFLLGILPFYHKIVLTLTSRQIDHCIQSLESYIRY